MLGWVDRDFVQLRSFRRVQQLLKLIFRAFRDLATTSFLAGYCCYCCCCCSVSLDYLLFFSFSIILYNIIYFQKNTNSNLLTLVRHHNCDIIVHGVRRSPQEVLAQEASGKHDTKLPIKREDQRTSGRTSLRSRQSLYAGPPFEWRPEVGRQVIDSLRHR